MLRRLGMWMLWWVSVVPYKNQRDKADWNMRDRQANPERHAEYKRRAYAKAKANKPVTPKAPKPVLTSDRQREKNRRSYRRLKALAHHRLGGACVKCGENDPVVLHVDHIEPILRGARGLPNAGRNMSYQTYKEVLNSDTPESKFQLLCANCHARKCHAERHLYAQGVGWSDDDGDDMTQGGAADVEQLCLL